MRRDSTSHSSCLYLTFTVRGIFRHTLENYAIVAIALVFSYSRATALLLLELDWAMVGQGWTNPV